MTEQNNTPEHAQDNKLNGNDAVNLAAEQSKETAHRNIPELGFEDMPLEADTANLRYGPSLHDGLLALLPLVGVWSGSGQANDPSDPEGEEYAFGQQLIVSHDGENYLRFESRIWRLDSEGNATGADQREVGFWRISASTIATETGPAAHGPGKRLYGLMPNNNLGWVDERVVDGESVPYMSAELKRVAG